MGSRSDFIGWLRCLNMECPGTLGAVAGSGVEDVKEKAREEHRRRHLGCEGPVQLLVLQDGETVLETDDLIQTSESPEGAEKP